MRWSGWVGGALAGLVFGLAHAQAPLGGDKCSLIQSPVSRAGEWTLEEGRLRTLWNVHRRLAQVAGLQPDLVLSESAQAQAMALARPQDDGVVMVTTGLVRLVRGDADELAAVLGHELGHLIHRHRDKKLAVSRALVGEAQREHQRQLKQGVKRREAAALALDQFVEGFSAFSRVAEREADDEGFSLSRRAGFDASGARRISEKMLKLQGGDQRGYAAAHPGWSERLQSNSLLEVNERLRGEAERHFVRRDTAQLGLVLEHWRARIPNSGAEAYYRALHSLMSGTTPGRMSAAFEQAVRYFREDGFSPAGQSYQAEAQMAVVALCVSLHREGRKLETLHCLDLLETDREFEAFRDISGWREFFAVKGHRRGRGAALYSAADGEGRIVLTNCRRLAEQEGYRPVQAWRPAREAQPPAAGPGPVACAPDLCECAAPEAAALEALRGR